MKNSLPLDGKSLRDLCDNPGYYGNHIWESPVWISVKNGSRYFSGKIKRCKVCKKDIINKMKIKYKRIKVAVAHCSICGERLQGDGSLANPYSCSCGTWKNNWENPFEYELSSKEEGEK